MALQGVHITFGAVSAPTPAIAALPVNAVAAQTMTSAGTSTISAPAGGLLLSISASAPIFYTTGANPADPSLPNSPRRYLGGTSREDMFVNKDDKFAWVFA